MQNEMNCQEAQNLIPSYMATHEPWLGLKDRAALEVHLEECDTCWEEYEESHRAVEFLRRHGKISADAQALLRQCCSEGVGANIKVTSTPNAHDLSIYGIWPPCFYNSQHLNSTLSP